jgi:hypothetical protein
VVLAAYGAQGAPCTRFLIPEGQFKLSFGDTMVAPQPTQWTRSQTQASGGTCDVYRAKSTTLSPVVLTPTGSSLVELRILKGTVSMTGTCPNCTVNLRADQASPHLYDLHLATLDILQTSGKAILKNISLKSPLHYVGERVKAEVDGVTVATPTEAAQMTIRHGRAAFENIRGLWKIRSQTADLAFGPNDAELQVLTRYGTIDTHWSNAAASAARLQTDNGAIHLALSDQTDASVAMMAKRVLSDKSIALLRKDGQHLVVLGSGKGRIEARAPRGEITIKKFP